MFPALSAPSCALDVEVSDPEIDPHAHKRKEIDGELVQFGAYFGFGDLQPVELVDLEYQIAQKLHAVTDPAYERAHDLVDLQLLWGADPDLTVLQRLCERTFDWRHQQAWPPLPLRPMGGWELAYADGEHDSTDPGAHASGLECGRRAPWWWRRCVSASHRRCRST